MAPCLRPPFKLPEFIEATGIAKIRQAGQFSPAKGISNKTCGISTKKKPLDFTFETGFSRNQIGFHPWKEVFLRNYEGVVLKLSGADALVPGNHGEAGR